MAEQTFSPVGAGTDADSGNRANVASATVIAVKDMLVKDYQGNLIPFSDLPDAGSAAANQALAAARFVGVSQEKSASGDTEDVLYATEINVRFTCASASFSDGDLVGPAENSDGDALENQAVIAVDQIDRAIGRVVGDHSSVTTVPVRLLVAGYKVPDLVAEVQAELNSLNFSEDFTAYDTDGFSNHLVLYGDTGTEAQLDAQGGGISLATGNTDNDQTGLSTGGEPFLFNAKQEIAVAARLSVTEIDSGNLDSSWCFGLSSTQVDVLADAGSGPPADYSGALIFKVETGTALQAETSVGTTQDTDTDVGTYAGTGEVWDLVIHYAPISSTQGVCRFWVNGTLAHTSTITFSGATEMHLLTNIKTHAAQVETMKLFKVACRSRFSQAAA